MAEEADGGLVGFLRRLTHLSLAYSAEGTQQIRRTVRQLARLHGGEAEVALQADSAVLTVERDGATHSVAVTAFPDVARLDRITDLRDVVERARRPSADLDQLSAEIDRIARSAPPYPPWLKSLGVLLFTIGFSVNVQATWTEVGVAALTGLAVAILVWMGGRLPRTALLMPLLSASAVSAIVLLVYEDADLSGGPILLMVPALFYFIPGDFLSASMFELAEGHLSSGATRLIYTMFVLLLLYVGVVFGVVLTGTDPDTMFETTASPKLPTIALWAGWGLFTFGFMFAFAAPMRFLAWILAVAYVTFGAQQLATLAFGEVFGTFVAATIMIVVAHLVSRDPARPPLIVLALCAFFVLTVGSLGLRGLTTWIGGNTIEGFQDLGQMFTIGAAIALGMLTGTVVDRIIDRP